MSKTAKVILGIIIAIVVVLIIIAGIIFWVGRGMISSVQEEGFISVIERFTGEDTGFEIDTEEGTVSFGDEDEEFTFRTEDGDGEGEIMDDFQGIPLPEVKMVQVMSFQEGDFHQAAYEFTEEVSVEELESFYLDYFEDQEWTSQSVMTTQEGKELTFSKEDGSFLQMIITEDELFFSYEPAN